MITKFRPKSKKPAHPPLTPHMQVLAYGGDSDYICNVFGIEAWTESLPGWKEAEGYRATPGRVWRTTAGQ